MANIILVSGMALTGVTFMSIRTGIIYGLANIGVTS